jgi:hypothetical protein
MTKEEAIEIFGVNPEAVGHRYRGWWIVEAIDSEEETGNAKLGYLCVKTRDGGGNPVSADAFKVGNCVGSSEDWFDRTYRYYYYAPLTTPVPIVGTLDTETMQIKQKSDTNK